MRRFLKSVGCAVAGLCEAVPAERHLRVHLVAAAVAIALGVYLGLSPVEWDLVIMAIGTVLTAELLNAAIERLGSQVAGGKHNEMVRRAKDAAAAAVLIAALAALAIGILVLIIPLVRRLVG